VALFPLYTAVSVVTALSVGLAIDRVGTARLIPLYLLPMGAGFALLGVVQTIGGAAVSISLMGLSHGAGSTLLGAFWAEFYGTRNVGSIRAAAMAIGVFGSAMGPLISGALIDAGLTFPQQTAYIAAYFAVAAAFAAVGVLGHRHRLPVFAIQ
jgi:MFS family permease